MPRISSATLFCLTQPLQHLSPNQDASPQRELSLLLQEKEQRSAEASILTSSHSSSFVAPEKKERLNNDDILRYSRQLILPEIGVKGKLFETKWAWLTMIRKLKLAS